MGFLRLALCFGIVSIALAQSNATDAAIEGWVKDATGAGVPKARVQARNTATNVEDSTEANQDGYFRFPLVRIGEYEIRVSHPGFKESRQVGILLSVGQKVRVDANLQATRSFRFRERYQASALIETENSLNSTNPNCSITSGCTGAVVNNVNAADFGRITSARSARNV